MLFIALALGAAHSFFNKFRDAQLYFKIGRDLADEIQTQVDLTKESEFGIENHTDYIENKNYKIEAYQNLAEQYFFEGKYLNSVRAYKKLMQLAWQDKDSKMEMKAYHGMAL